MHFVDHLEAHGEALFAKVCELDFEGIVAKQADSVYKAGRRPEWIKVKNPNYSRQEALRFGDELTSSSVRADNKIGRRPIDSNRAAQ